MFLGSFFFFADSVEAATYYVDVNNGIDSRNITQAQDINTPLKSLAKPFVSGWIQWGDTIKLKSGTYTGGDDTGGIWISGAGRWLVLSAQVSGSTSNGPLTITIAPGADVTIDMPTITLDGYIFRPHGNFVIAGESALNKLKITNTQNSTASIFSFENNAGEWGITIQDTTIDWNNSNSTFGIGIVQNTVTSYNQNITFRRCEIKNTGTTLSSQSIIRSQPVAPIFTNLTFESCLLHDIGYLFYQAAGNMNVTLTNNTITGVKVANTWGNSISASSTFTIKNNIFNGNSIHKDLLYAYPQTYAQIQANWTVKNNILYRPITVDPGTEIDRIGYSGNDFFPIDETNYYINPLFASTSDFTLQSGSYASGRGNNDAVPSSGGDINGNAYNGSDVGCYSNPVAAILPTITDGTAAFIGDSISENTGKRATTTSWLSSDLTIVGSAASCETTANCAAVGGSGGQATKFYVDRAAINWGPKYIFFLPYHNNYPSGVATPSNLTYAEAADDMAVAMKKAEYWGITPIFVGMSGVMGADPTTKPSSVNGAVAAKCATNGWSCGSFVDYMATINPSSWNLAVASGGYYETGGLAASVHPASEGYDVALDEAEYLFYSKSIMGSSGVDIGAGARVYGDGKFRDIGTASGSAADLVITPESGSFTPYNYSAWMDVSNITWFNTGTHHKAWTESSTFAGLTNTVHTVGDLEADTYYNVSVDSIIGQNITGDNCTSGVCLSNSQGEVVFTYTGTYSDHNFDVEKKDVTAPTGFSLSLGSVTSSSILASVSGATDDISGLHSTPYYFDRNSGSTVSGWQAGTSWEDTGLSENTQYSYKVKARDVATSPNESSFTATQSKYTLADTPTNLVADTVGQTAITFSVDSFPNDTSDSSGYYFANTTNSTNSGWIQTNSWQNANLTCGTSYNYTVKYRNGDGTETDTIALTQATGACDDDAEDLEITDMEYSSTENSITVKWKTNNYADSRVEYGKDRDMDQDKEDNDNEKNHKIILKDLEPDTLYYFKAKSEDENGSEDSSDRKSIRTKKQNTASGFIGTLFNPSNKSEDQKESGNSKESTGDIIEKINEIPAKIQEKMEGTQFFNADVFKKEDKKYLSEVKFQIIDELDNPIPNLSVTLHSDPQTATTDDQGIATFQNVPTGRHTLAFTYQNEKFNKKIAIAEPAAENGKVKAEIITIKAEKDGIPVWMWGVVAALLLALILVWKYKRKERKS